jgi:uncharacterized protein (TIGR02588 family)
MNVQKNAVEWSVFAIALAIVVACIAVLIATMLPREHEPPALVLTAGAPLRSSGGFRVPIHIRNDGDETAEAVQVEVVLDAGDTHVERAELTFAFVPRHSRREGYVVFATDPRCCRIAARAIGFARP